VWGVATVQPLRGVNVRDTRDNRVLRHCYCPFIIHVRTCIVCVSA
jgi:hypothetical protein